MPKKTKRQKMAAEKRKIYHPHHEVEKIVEVEEPKIPKITKNPSLIMSNTSTEIFKKDLSRSLLISAIIILVEIGIYLAQNKVIPVTNLIQ